MELRTASEGVQREVNYELAKGLSGIIVDEVALEGAGDVGDVKF
jgi:hypothetical protein